MPSMRFNAATCFFARFGMGNLPLDLTGSPLTPQSLLACPAAFQAENQGAAPTGSVIRYENAAKWKCERPTRPQGPTSRTRSSRIQRCTSENTSHTINSDRQCALEGRAVFQPAPGKPTCQAKLRPEPMGEEVLSVRTWCSSHEIVAIAPSVASPPGVRV